MRVKIPDAVVINIVCCREQYRTRVILARTGAIWSMHAERDMTIGFGKLRVAVLGYSFPCVDMPQQVIKLHALSGKALGVLSSQVYCNEEEKRCSAGSSEMPMAQEVFSQSRLLIGRQAEM